MAGQCGKLVQMINDSGRQRAWESLSLAATDDAIIIAMLQDNGMAFY